MRITITVAGSRGDVQPCVALGRGLRAVGHEVTVATHSSFEGLVREAGLTFFPVAGPAPDRIMVELLRAGRNPLRYARTFRPLLESSLEQSYTDYRKACRGADAVLYTPVGFLGYMVAQELELVCMGTAVEPIFSRTSRFPSSVLGRPPGGQLLSGIPVMGGLYSYLSYIAVEQLYWQTLRPLVGSVREKTGLPQMPWWGPFGRMNRDREPILYGWSPSVLPEPSSRKGWTRTTGYWFLGDGERWQPPRELTDFLEAGPPPVAVGFGSLSGVSPEAEIRCALEALGRMGQRGVLVTGWEGISNADLPDEVLKIVEAPYEWLFERACASINHGGAGTVATALRAGIPSVVVPALPDQHFWGWRVAVLGAGTSPIPYSGLSPERLIRAVRKVVMDDGVRGRAAQLGRRIRFEDGVGQAVEAFHRYIPG